MSKEVTHVISDTPESKFPSSAQSCGVGPPSPWTPTQTPSPATSTSAVDSDRRNRAPLSSRAEAILAKVKNSSSRANTSASVLETAKRLNCQIWSLAKTLQWLTKFKVKFGSVKVSSRAPENKLEKKRLVPPSIKLENETPNWTRPVYLELKSWPELRFDGRPGSSPFSVPSHSKQKTKQKISKRLVVDREETTDTASKAIKKEEKAACAAQKKKAAGFCEICNINYSELEKHLGTSQHQQFVSEHSNWIEVDQLCVENISQFPMM